MIETIEQAIKQKKPFKNEFEKALVNLIYTTGHIKKNQSQFFDQYDITGQQYNILRILRGAKKTISTSDIRERLLDSHSDTSRLVNRMAKKGLVTKKTCGSDTRKVDVELSTAGLSLLKEINKSIQKAIDPIANLTEKEAKQLNTLLDKIRA